MTIIKKTLTACAGAALLAAPASWAHETANAPTKGETRLAKMLEGRVAGDPQSCIRLFPNADVTVIDKTAIVYESGNTLYVNVPRDPDSLDNRDTMVRRTTMGSQLCNTDIITTVDPLNGMYTGNIMLTQFVPYRKAES